MPTNVSRDSLSDAESQFKSKNWAETIRLFEAVWAFLNAGEKRWHVARFAKALRKEGGSSDAVALFEELYGGPPAKRWERQEYLWCLYDSKVKVWGREADLDAAKTIVSLSSHKDKYSPYNHTVLRAARYQMGEGDFLDAVEWLKKTSPDHLDDEAYYHAETERWYSSQRLRYFSMLVESFQQVGDYERTVRSCIGAMERCYLGNRSETTKWYEGPIWQFYVGLIRASSSLQEAEGREHILRLLNRNGFKSGKIRSGYLAALLGEIRHEDDWSCLWDRYKSEEGTNRNALPDSAAIRRVAEAVRSLEIESQIKHAGRARAKRGIPSKVTATELADHVFCPASHAIKRTYHTGTTEPMKLGTKLHEESLLDTRRRFQGLGGWKRSKRDPLAYLRGHVPAADLRLHRSALTDIATAEVFFADRADLKQRPFRNDAMDFEGLPDYVFQRRDGARFVVEEKFRSGSAGDRRADRPFASHYAQLASYIHYLSELEAQYGYLVYWYPTFQGVDGSDTKGAGQSTTMSGCAVFKVVKSNRLRARLDSVLTSVRSTKSGLPAPFDNAELNPVKCASCSVTEFCSHKTGRFANVVVPYSIGGSS